MGGYVQRLPSGLLEVLGAKVGGVNPSDLSPDIVPSIDLLQFYSLSTQTYKTVTGAPVEGAAIVLTVPDNEWWILHNLSCRFDKTATATLVTVSLRQKTNLTSPLQVVLAQGPVGDLVFGSTPASDVAIAIYAPDTPKLLPPGTCLMAVLDILGTDLTATLTLDARVGVLT